jgi:hypothetical protein
MRLKEAIGEKILDLRLRDKLLAEGKITQAEIDKYLEQLPDNAETSEMVDSGRLPSPSADKH